MPCRSFATAISQTSANGEVIVIDSAGYGTVIINQAVSLVAPFGVYAGISAFTGDGIFVNAPGGVVSLRNLTINSQGAMNGINIQNAAGVFIDHCLVSGFFQNDINVSLASGAVTRVAVSDTTLQAAGAAGLYVTGGNVSLSMVRCRLQSNASGLLADTVLGIAVRDSDADGNSGAGFYLRGTGGAGFAAMTIQSSAASNNSVGFEVDAGILSVFGSTASRNSMDGFLANGSGAVLSVNECIASKNFQNGVHEILGAMDVSNSTLADNSGAGIFVSATAKLVRNTITRNHDGINNNGVIHSSGDNVVDGNLSSEVTGPGTITAANKT